MPEVLRCVPIDDIVLDIIKKSHIKCKHTDLWNISIIVPVPKSGDLAYYGNQA